MNLKLNEEQLLMQKMVKDFARGVLSKTASLEDKEKRFPKENIKKIAELGLMGVNIPMKYNGSEAGVIMYSLAVTELAKISASVAVTMMVTNMAAEIINYFGTDEQKDEFIPKIMSGEYLTGAFGLSEPGYGSDAGSLKTSATKDGDYYYINGQKSWITNGTYAGVFIVFARTNKDIKGAKGLSAFLVKPGVEGFTIGKEESKMGLKSSSTVSLSFDNVKVHKSQLLGKEGDGFKIAMTALDGGRIGVASQALGIALGALEEAKQYVKERKQFNKRIADFQAIQWMIADSETELEAARLLILQAAYLKESGAKNFTKQAAMAKYFATEKANVVVGRTLQMLGGYGYVEDFNIERYYRDVKVTTIYEGTSQIQQLVIGRAVLN